ncbi:MAG: transcriptional regulator NrdR [Firmicutes bacterium]|nr:transcriptional regulator NrdR [Bacillota bacterium]MCD7782920.1 transcriptional regulator NrdR [Bacillota bacterium]MCD7831545.1 transcriptional regulator NrdR [Bacillota bacterium]
MKCPVCGYGESRVVDSRPSSDGTTIRRRRECLSCRRRFTTYEMVDVVHPVVIKRDGTRELFDKNKLLVGLIKACEKRPIKAEVIANDIEASLAGSLSREIQSSELGEMVLVRLKRLDPVAYVRFASVYREFNDVETFIEEIRKLQSETDGK